MLIVDWVSQGKPQLKVLELACISLETALLEPAIELGPTTSTWLSLSLVSLLLLSPLSWMTLPFL